MINLVKPKFFIPIHGDYRHLKRHAELAGSMGVVEKAILLEDGEILELDRGSASKTGKVTVGRVCIDSGGASTDVVEDIVIRDNHLFKPLRWKAGDPSFDGHDWSIKNSFELKNARRVLVEGNVFENNWVDSQAGFAILLTVRGEGYRLGQL